MDLSSLITRIDTNCATFLQVLDPSGVTRDTLDTSAALYTLLSSTFSNRLYPLTMPKEEITLPSAVYSLQSSQKIPINNVDMMQQDVFVLYFHTETTNTSGGFNQLVTLRETVRDVITAYGTSSSAIEIEIVDESMNYLEDLDRYQCAMQIHITHIIGVNQSAPVVFIVEDSSSSAPSEHDSCTIQDKETNLSLIIVCDLTDLETARACLQSQLVGYQLTSSYDSMEMISEGRIDTVGDMVVWQQQYSTSIQVRQA